MSHCACPDHSKHASVMQILDVSISSPCPSAIQRSCAHPLCWACEDGVFITAIQTLFHIKKIIICVRILAAVINYTVMIHFQQTVCCHGTSGADVSTYRLTSPHMHECRTLSRETFRYWWGRKGERHQSCASAPIKQQHQ